MNLFSIPRYFLLLTIVPCLAISEAYDEIYKQQIYAIAAYGIEQSVLKPNPEPETLKSFSDAASRLFTFFFGKKSILDIPELSRETKQDVAFSFLAPAQTSPETPSDTSDRYTIIDAEFVINNDLVAYLVAHNGPDTTKGHFIDTMFSDNGTPLLITSWGRKECTEIITEPISDIQTLKARQIIIKKLLDNEDLFNQITVLMSKINEYDNALSLFHLNHKFVLELLLNKDYTYKAWPLKKFNNSPKLIQWDIIQSDLFILLGGIGLGTAAQQICKTKSGNQLRDALTVSSVSVTGSALSTLFLAAYIKINTQYRTIQKLMMDTARLCSTTQDMFNLLNTHHLTTLSPALNNLNLSTHKNTELQELITLLNTSTFSGDPSVFSYLGRVVQAANILKRPSVQKAFVPLLKAIGELDTYLAIARKIKMSQKTGTPYCFATYVDDSTAPYIQATNFFNPFLTKPVVNSIEIGTLPNTQNGIRTIVLSGPNTGGKSTSINGITYAILLAQTVGIAPATTFVLTPFDKLICHRNVADDITTDTSGYQAEVDSVKQMFKTIQTAQDRKGYVFITLDELFRSTTPEQGDNLTTQVINELAQEYPNTCITMIATHFSSPRTLANTNPYIANYRMGTVLNEDGSVKEYTYKLEPGVSLVHNAQQIATELNIFNTSNAHA